jgi:membrane protein
MQTSDILPLIKQTFQEYGEDNVGRLAAALAYYTVFSLAPLLVIVIAVTGLVIGSQADIRAEIMNQIQAMIGSEAAAGLIESMIDSSQNTSAGIFATILGVATLIFGATGFFIQLQGALNTIWDVEEKSEGGVLGMLRARFLSFTLILGIGFLLLVSLVLSAALSILANYAQGLFPGSAVVWQVADLLISLAVITLLFAMIFRFLPDVDIAWRDVWLGAFVTALLFTLGKWAIGLYLGTRGLSDAYGAAGALIVILLWVYYSAQILFLGAEFTQVYARRHGKAPLPEVSQTPTETTAPAPALTALLTAPARRQHQTDLLPQPQPSLLAFSGVVMALVGFLGGWVLRRGGRGK